MAKHQYFLNIKYRHKEEPTERGRGGFGEEPS